VHILVVEDDEYLSEIYPQILECLGPVKSCLSMSLALLAIKVTVPEVVILDLGLPDSQGLDGLARIREKAPAAAVVITTGESDENLAIEALRRGAQDYLLKGKLDKATLLRSVRYALERKQTENKLRRSEELFSVITNSIVDLLSIIDSTGKRLYASPSYQRVLGYSEEEMAGLDLSDLVHLDDRSKIQEALARLFSEGTSEGLEYRVRHKNGAYLVFESNAACIRDTQSGVPQAVFVARDVTARKQAEAEHNQMEMQLRQAQKLESIGQLAAGIAHEINTPTQYIGDNTIFLRDAFKALGEVVVAHQALLARYESGDFTTEEISAVRRQFDNADLGYLLEEIPKAIIQTMEGVKRVTRIVGAMKEFSHPGSDTKTRTDLNRAIESTVTVCRNEWKYVADLELDLAPDLPFVLCLPSDFNQAILNLVINAAHAIEDARSGDSKTKGLIRISTRQVDEVVEIRVQDTGCGIPAGIQSRIFDPFFTTKVVGKGTGQGLAIVHSVIVEKHKGSISLESNVGEGTTFVLRLPLKEV
jgi:two-component system, NtrC family, sensor kinase